MPAFVPPFDLTAVAYVDDVLVELPDPPHAPLDPIVRPGVARYAGRTLVMMHVRPLASPVDLKSPVIGTACRVNLPGVLAGTNELLEIEPLPFRIQTVLQNVPAGAPTFYVASSNGVGASPDHDLLVSGGPIVTASADLYVGVFFQDGAALSPWAWIDSLGRAMAEAGDSTGADTWNELANLYSGVGRTLRVLDHDGRPAGAGLAFDVSINGQPPATLTTSAASELTLSPGTVGISWQGSPLAGDTTLPVQAIHQASPAPSATTDLSAPPGERIILPSDFARGHLQVLDLSRWYSIPPTDSSARRFHANCRVEPLLDGVATFKRIVDDLLASAGGGGSAYFSGLIFNNFDLDKARKDPASPADDLDTTLIGLTNYLRDRDTEVRMQFDKFIKLKDPDQFTNVVRMAAFAVVTIAASAASVLAVMDRFRKSFPADKVGFAMMWGLDMLSVKLVELLTVSRLEDVIEPSIDIFKELNDIEKHLAIWGRHPVRMADNPLADFDLLPGLRVEDIQEKFGSWHQKIQAITRVTPDTQGNVIVGYVGGIDINKNRLDTPGHQAAAPYHDVHSRVTGTAAFDVHRTWRDRYAFEKQQHITIDGDNTVPDLVTPLPDYRVMPSKYPAQSAKHLVQIGRTFFRASGGGSALPFSTSGERTTYDTYLRAIKAACTYIHLEDQYFTPNTSTLLENPPGTRHPDVFLDVLLDAAVTCKRLVVMLPREGDQPFGQHRRAFVISKLRAAWGDRIFIGVPLRRPVLPEAGVVASIGRGRLLEDVAETSGSPILVGPHARVPEKPPFWLWIYGELMLCTHVEDDVDAEQLPARRMTVVRGGDWGARPREHLRGAPVTFSQLRGPYVHAKVIVVDDMFVGIGTTNLTRRAFFHEGEIHAFAVPEQLRAAPDNPAFALRTALWAEHLGLPASVGSSLLGDPMAAFEYFRRSMFAGNRSVPVETVNERPHMGGSFDEDSITGALKNLLGLSAAAIAEPFWNTFSDATTAIEPHPLAGPFE